MSHLHPPSLLGASIGCEGFIFLAIGAIGITDELSQAEPLEFRSSSAIDHARPDNYVSFHALA